MTRIPSQQIRRRDMTLFGILRVGRVGRAIADDLDTRLDERQLAERNSAYLDS